MRDTFQEVYPWVNDANFLEAFQSEGSLGKKLAELQPAVIVSLLRSIEGNVRRAASSAEWAGQLEFGVAPKYRVLRARAKLRGRILDRPRDARRLTRQRPGCTAPDQQDRLRGLPPRQLALVCGLPDERVDCLPPKSSLIQLRRDRPPQELPLLQPRDLLFRDCRDSRHLKLGGPFFPPCSATGRCQRERHPQYFLPAGTRPLPRWIQTRAGRRS